MTLICLSDLCFLIYRCCCPSKSCTYLSMLFIIHIHKKYIRWKIKNQKKPNFCFSNWSVWATGELVLCHEPLVPALRGERQLRYRWKLCFPMAHARKMPLDFAVPSWKGRVKVRAGINLWLIFTFRAVKLLGRCTKVLWTVQDLWSEQNQPPQIMHNTVTFIISQRTVL